MMELVHNHFLPANWETFLEEQHVPPGGYRRVCITNSRLTLVDSAAFCRWLLPPSTHLTRLDLTDNYIDTASSCVIAAFVQHNASLQELNLASNPTTGSGAAWAAALGANSSLRRLRLRNNLWQLEDWEPVLQRLTTIPYPPLTCIDFSGLKYNGNPQLERLVTLLCRVIKLHPTLTHLTLDSCDLDDSFAYICSIYLMQNQRLQYLDLWNNCISWSGVSALLASLYANTTLWACDLGFQWPPFMDYHEREDDSWPLCRETVNHNTTLRYLYLPILGLGSSDALIDMVGQARRMVTQNRQHYLLQGWGPLKHRYCPRTLQLCVWTLWLLYFRTDNLLHTLPRELIFYILSFLTPRDFDAPDLYVESEVGLIGWNCEV